MGARVGGGVRFAYPTGQPELIVPLEACLRFKKSIFFASLIGGTWVMPSTRQLVHPRIATQVGFELWRITLGVEPALLFTPISPIVTLEGRIGFRIF